MNLWQEKPINERIAMVQHVYANTGIEELAVEKETRSHCVNNLRVSFPIISLIFIGRI